MPFLLVIRGVTWDSFGCSFSAHVKDYEKADYRFETKVQIVTAAVHADLEGGGKFNSELGSVELWCL